MNANQAVGEIGARGPDLVLFAATSRGRDLAPRVAARLGVGLVSECETIWREGEELVFARPAHGGMVVADVVVRTRPAMATVRVARLCPGGTDLETADIVIGVGTGIGGPENLPTIASLADVLGAAVGGTRKVVDLGWVPPRRQIGLSGRQIAPRVYLALGVRGSFNHAIGIRRAGTVIAVNTDPRAEIFGECDLGVMADWREVVAGLMQ